MPGSNRQRELARRRTERQAARRIEAAARKRKQRFIIGGSGLGVLALILVIFFVVNSNDGGKKKVAAAPGGCSYTESGAKSAAGLPATTGFDKKPRTATIKLDAGTVTVELASDKAPCTVASFEHLASKKFFDGTKCHRLTTSGIFVLQCGDPTGTGSGGPGYQFADENVDAAKYPAGTVAMANSGPGTNGSQFFLVYKDTDLPPSYTPFGKITAGLDVVAKVAAVGTKDGSGDGAPKNDVKIESFTVAAG